MARRSMMVVVVLLVGHALAQAAPPEQAMLARGKYLVEGVLACANCHGTMDASGKPLAGKGLAGGRLLDEPVFKAYASNISMDAATGVGAWTDAQLGRAIREGLRPDGSVIGPPMPAPYYRHISDTDLAAIVAYLKTQPAIKNTVAKSSYSMPLPPNYGPPLAVVQAPPRTDKVKYGEYLSDLGHCMECHTPRMPTGMIERARLGAGGSVFNGPWGASVSRNLTPHETGLKNWSDAQIAKAVRQGVDRSGAHYKPPMAFEWYRNISDEDMGALIAYLRALPPVPFAGTP